MATSGLSSLVGLWVIFALARVGCTTIFDIGKKAIARNYHQFQIALVITVIALLLYAPIAFALRGARIFTALSPVLIGLALVTAGFQLGSLYASLLAMKHADVSVVSPVQKMYPIFVALLEPLFLAISPTPETFLGAFLGAVGGYTVTAAGGSFLAPVNNLTSRGVVYAVLAGLSLAGVVVVDRIGLAALNIDPFVYVLYVNVGLVVISSIAVWINGLGFPEINQSSYRWLPTLGVLAVGQATFGYLALSMASGTRVSVIFQLAIPLTVLVGGNVFDEWGDWRVLTQRVVGSLVLLIGVVLIT